MKVEKRPLLAAKSADEVNGESVEHFKKIEQLVELKEKDFHSKRF